MFCLSTEKHEGALRVTVHPSVCLLRWCFYLLHIKKLTGPETSDHSGPPSGCGFYVISPQQLEDVLDRDQRAVNNVDKRGGSRKKNIYSFSCSQCRCRCRSYEAHRERQSRYCTIRTRTPPNPADIWLWAGGTLVIYSSVLM